MDEIVKSQTKVCLKYGSPYVPCHLVMKVGIGKNFDASTFPINGLRHPPQGDTTGWYIWTGEWSDAPDFLVPLHVVHLIDRHPKIIQYLGLAPGWRFLFAPEHEDVWEDKSLLSI